MVFCMVDGGKQFAAKHRHDARVVHAELVALIRGLLRQVGGRGGGARVVHAELVTLIRGLLRQVRWRGGDAMATRVGAMCDSEPLT